MSTQTQSRYIADLAVAKTKEFKEVKELLISNEIIGADAEIVKEAESIAEITDALDDLQASRLIDVLVATKEPARDRAYSDRRIKAAIRELDAIKDIIDDWEF